MKMATMRMTMIGLYNYDPTLFDGADFPEGIDKELVVESILLRCGESPALFQSAPFMKMKISNTARKWYNNIEHMLKAINEDYNPLHNYDRYEEWTENDKKSETTNRTEKVTDTNKTEITDKTKTEITDKTETESRETNDIESEKNGETHDDISKTTQNDVSAFNSSDYQPSDKTTESGSNDSNNSEEITTQSTNIQNGSGQNNRNESGETNRSESGENDRDVKGNNKYETDNNLLHNAHLYGNIGVTTSQQMLESEFELRQNINIYDVIAEIFFKELCIYVY